MAVEFQPQPEPLPNPSWETMDQTQPGTGNPPATGILRFTLGEILRWPRSTPFHSLFPPCAQVNPIQPVSTVVFQP